MRTAWLMGCLLSLLLSPSQAAPPDAGLHIARAELHLHEAVYHLDADLSLGFHEAIIEALSSGIPLTLETRFEVQRRRPWLWNAPVIQNLQRHMISYHPLSRRYLIINLNTHRSQDYPDAQSALLALSRIRDLPVLEQQVLFPHADYLARLRVQLDIDALPTPLRLWAYISPAWQLRSPWYRWPLN